MLSLFVLFFAPSVLCVWTPAPGTTWNWQLNQPVDTTISVSVIDLDLFETPASVIATLKAQGKKVICYFSSQYEGWRPDAASFPASVKGAGIDGWPNENWVDVTKISILEPIMAARLDMAVQKGCDGVEPDNVDGYAASNGFGTTYAQQLVYNKKLAQLAHDRRLAVGLKNDLDQVEDLVSYFDFAVNEQCFQYTECDMLAPFVAAGKAVFNCEYKGTAATFTSSVCPSAVAQRISSIFKRLELDAPLLAACQRSSSPPPSSPPPPSPPPSPAPTPVVCSGVTCPVPTNQCKKAACSSSGSCVVRNRVGTCNDGNACTKSDTCSSGVCTGTKISGCTIPQASVETTTDESTQDPTTATPTTTTTTGNFGNNVPGWGVGLLAIASVIIVLLVAILVVLRRPAVRRVEKF